jgi:heme/copper-type cytochrome/quinol oxidase subunit 2
MEKILITLTALVLLGWLTRYYLLKVGCRGKRMDVSAVVLLIASANILSIWICFLSEASKSTETKIFITVFVCLVSIAVAILATLHVYAWRHRPKKIHVTYVDTIEPGNEIDDAP